MQIKLLNKDKIEIKTKDATIIAGDEVKINDVKLLGSGEYEIGGVEVFGLVDNVYVFHTDGIAIGYFYGLNRDLTDLEIESLNMVEIAILPVGGGNVLDSKKALSLAKRIDTRIIIPVQVEDTKEFCDEVGDCLEPVDVFKTTKQQVALMEGLTVVQIKV